jgi:hypothetical protein
VGAVASPKYTVSDVEMMLEHTDLASDTARMDSHSNSSGYMISFESFANYASALEANASNINVLIPARYSSLKTLFINIRHSTNLKDYTKSSISERANIIGDT